MTLRCSSERHSKDTSIPDQDAVARHCLRSAPACQGARLLAGGWQGRLRCVGRKYRRACHAPASSLVITTLMSRHALLHVQSLHHFLMQSDTAANCRAQRNSAKYWGHRRHLIDDWPHVLQGQLSYWLSSPGLPIPDGGDWINRLMASSACISH
jgi:hypothetical protein